MVSRKWTEDELTQALSLYGKLSFGQFHRSNQDVIKLAAAVDRTPDAVAMKLCNLASLDPEITGSGRKGLAKASKLDRQMWSRLRG